MSQTKARVSMHKGHAIDRMMSPVQRRSAAAGLARRPDFLKLVEPYRCTDQREVLAAFVRQSTGLWCGSARPDATTSRAIVKAASCKAPLLASHTSE
jgi:hypothetical protein